MILIMLFIKQEIGKISDKNRIKLQSTIWLNIDYYVKDKDKKEELMEMIKVQESQEQDFFKWQEELVNRMEEQGMEKGRNDKIQSKMVRQKIHTNRQMVPIK